MSRLGRVLATAPIVAAVAAAGGLFAGCGGGGGGGSSTAAAGGKTQIKIADLAITSNAVLAMARQKGWFAAEKLDVSVNDVPNPPAVVATLQGGQADIGYSPSIPMLNAVSQGVDVKVVAPADGYRPGAYKDVQSGSASASKFDDTAILVRPDSGITSAKDLAGKTVAVPARKAQMEVTIANTVKEQGGDPTKVRWIAIDFASMDAALQAKRVDAIGATDPFVGKAEAHGAKPIAYPGLSTFQQGAVGLWIAKGSWASQHKDAVARFRRVIAKANAYADAHPQELLTFASKTTQTPIDTLKKSHIPYWPTSPVSAEDLGRPADAMVSLGYLTKKPDVPSLLFAG